MDGGARVDAMEQSTEHRAQSTFLQLTLPTRLPAGLLPAPCTSARPSYSCDRNSFVSERKGRQNKHKDQGQGQG